MCALKLIWTLDVGCTINFLHWQCLWSAVRTGNLNNFNQTLSTYADKFSAEGTYTLIVRLRHNVIKTGVRMINLSYSRISLADIADKLQLGSSEDAEFIIAKVTVAAVATRE